MPESSLVVITDMYYFQDTEAMCICCSSVTPTNIAEYYTRQPLALTEQYDLRDADDLQHRFLIIATFYLK